MPERATVSNWSEKSAEGVVDYAVGTAIEALQRRKAEKRIGWPETIIRRPKRRGVESAMTIRRALRQMSAEAERSARGQGEALSEAGSDEALRPRLEPEDTGPGLLHAVLARENMQQAWKRVRANKGAAGVDGLSIDETAELLCSEWPSIREQLLHGAYRPQPVRRVMIPKPDGGRV